MFRLAYYTFFFRYDEWVIDSGTLNITHNEVEVVSFLFTTTVAELQFVSVKGVARDRTLDQRTGELTDRICSPAIRTSRFSNPSAAYTRDLRARISARLAAGRDCTSLHVPGGGGDFPLP